MIAQPTSIANWILAFALIHFAHITEAQSISDSLVHKKVEEPHEAYSGLPRPSFEFGAGVLTFFGDVGSTSKVHPLVAPFGVQARLYAPLTPFLTANFNFLAGTLTGEDRTDGLNQNFKSQIKSGGISLSYNFSHFVGEVSPIKPYVSLGISVVEFLSKSDMKDKEGRTYYYWSDGTIRNLPENSPNASEAVFLVRDYTHETDLRELNSEGQGRYRLSTAAVPIGIGFTLRMNSELSFRMGADYYLTMTDNLDNVSSGPNNRNDRFLYTNFGFSYNLRIPEKTRKETESIIDFPPLLVSDFDDEDGDGVADIIDLCPFTPKGVDVDKMGCPLDKDGDGVPDYLDLEPDSPKGAIVDATGRALTDEDHYLMYLAYIDSTGNMQYKRSVTETEDVVHLVGGQSRKKTYMVLVGSGDKLPDELIAQILSQPDVSAIETEQGTAYVVGKYDDINGAVRRYLALKEQGIEGTVVEDAYGNLRLAQTAAQLVEDAMISIEEGEAIREASSSARQEVVFRVQIGAYRYKLSKDIFNNVEDLLIIQGDDGITRYVTGTFKTVKEAANHKVNLLLKGFDGAFITVYRGGKRISLEEAGVTTVSGSDPIHTEANDTPLVNKDLVKFAVQVGNFSSNVPAATLSHYMRIGAVRPVRASDGIKYIHGSFKTYEEAQSAREKCVSIGITDAFVVGDFNGTIISAEEARQVRSK